MCGSRRLANPAPHVCEYLLHAEIAAAGASARNDDLPWKTDHLRGERRVRDLSERHDPGQGCRRGRGRICRARAACQERKGTAPGGIDDRTRYFSYLPDCGPW